MENEEKELTEEEKREKVHENDCFACIAFFIYLVCNCWDYELPRSDAALNCLFIRVILIMVGMLFILKNFMVNSKSKGGYATLITIAEIAYITIPYNIVFHDKYNLEDIATAVSIISLVAVIALMLYSFYCSSQPVKYDLSKENIERLRKKAEETGDYSYYAKVAPTDYYAEWLYFILEMNRLHRRVAEYKREHNLEYNEAMKYILIEETPKKLKDVYIHQLQKAKTMSREWYSQQMSKQNETRPHGVPQYKYPEDILFYIPMGEIADYNTRKWVFSKGFVPAEYEKRIIQLGGRTEPYMIYHPSLPHQYGEMYEGVREWHEEVLLYPGEDFMDPSRIVIYPTVDDLYHVMIKTNIKQDRRIFERSEEFEKNASKSENTRKIEEVKNEQREKKSLKEKC